MQKTLAPNFCLEGGEGDAVVVSLSVGEHALVFSLRQKLSSPERLHPLQSSPFQHCIPLAPPRPPPRPPLPARYYTKCSPNPQSSRLRLGILAPILQMRRLSGQGHTARKAGAWQPAGPCTPRPGQPSTRLRPRDGSLRGTEGEMSHHPPQQELTGSLSLKVWVA